MAAAASADSQSNHVHTAIAGVSDTSIATAVATRTTRKQNNWRNARLRLMTLRTILQLDMWKDIKYGTVSARHARALTTWQKTLLHENVEFAKVTRWTTIEDNAIKWVDKFAKGERTQAFKTGHGDDSDEDEERARNLDWEWLTDLRGQFHSNAEQRVCCLLNCPHTYNTFNLSLFCFLLAGVLRLSDRLRRLDVCATGTKGTRGRRQKKNKKEIRSTCECWKNVSRKSIATIECSRGNSWRSRIRRELDTQFGICDG